MTDKPTPTDAELEALLLDKLPASKHYIRPVIEKMVAAMQAAIDKWGQPAQAAEPVAREQLTPEQIDQAIAELGLNYLADAHATNRAVLRKLCHHAHGIKGGQHVS